MKYFTIQKMYTGPTLVCFVCYGPNKTQYLYFSRELKNPNHFFVGLMPTLIPAHYRQKDGFLEFLKAHCNNFPFTTILKHKQLPIYALVSQPSVTKSLFFWCYYNSKLFFFFHNERNQQTHCSFFPQIDLLDFLKNNHPFSLLKILFGPQYEYDLLDFTEYVLPVGDYAQIEGNQLDKKYEKLQLNIQKSMLKKKGKIEEDIARASKWKEHFNLILNLYITDANQENSLENQREYIFANKKIKLPLGNHFKKREFLLNKLKGYKKGVDIQQQRLDELNDKIEHRTNEHKANGIPIGWKIPITIAMMPIKKKLGKEFLILGEKNIAGILGMNALENQTLRKNLMNRDNQFLWFHLKDLSSTHLFLFIHDICELTNEQIDSMASLLAYYSNFKGIVIDFMYAPIKSVESVKGKVGSIKVKNAQYGRGNWSPQWMNSITF